MKPQTIVPSLRRKFAALPFFCMMTIQVSLAQTQANVILNTPLTSGGTITATNSITLSDGFQFNSVNGTLLLKIFEPIPNSLPFNTLPSNENYIWTKTPLIKISDASQLNAKPTDQVMQSIQYLDGLGRPTQAIQIKGNHDATKDVIQPIGYDDYGRESVKYLPYADGANAAGSYRSDALSSGLGNFYNAGLPAGVSQNLNPYSQTIFEASPENRVTEQGGPGSAWQTSNGHTQKVVYGVNASPVIYYDAYYNTTPGSEYARALVSNGYYPTGALYLTITKDENWVSANGKAGTVEEYKDNEGRVVLKRDYKTNAMALSTYYVYDFKGNLTYVLPPGANPDAGSVSTAALSNFCYQYYYDERNRIIEKKLPGKDWEYTVYNSRNQVVLTQDGLQRASNKWVYAKYDDLGRPVITGIYTSANSRKQEQQNASQQFAVSESRDNTTVTGYTNNLAYPTANNGILLTVKYYDDYSFPNASTVAFSADNPGQALSTGTLVYDTDGLNPRLSASYYDSEEREIENVRKNNLGGTDALASTFSFTGKTLTSILTHTVSGVTTTVAKTYIYDHMDRKRETKEQINGGTPTVLSKTDLNDIGQLYIAHLHSEDDAATFLQDVSYAYNERGWLRTANSSSNIFNLELKYNNPDAGTANFNGNISQMLYNTTLNNPGQRKFTYAYDPLNRLTSAGSNLMTMDEAVTYPATADDMGNFVTLVRTGPQARNMHYYYQDASGNATNKLYSVTNNGGNFRNYDYDVNGNAKSDGNLTNTRSITYNMFNLPQTIKQNGSTVASYTYNGTGIKLKNIGGDGTWDYDGEIVYKNNAIAFIQTENGRAEPSGGNYSYFYDLKDHLGNTRVTFRKLNGALNVVQEDEYYAFGLRSSETAGSPANRYLYNGKEVQVDLPEQYDYGARFYDPVVGRMTTIDRFAEKYMSNSPYQYGANNPISNIDINGDSVIVSASITGNKVLNKAFNDFAGTKAGRAFLSNYAAKGQTINGYTFTANGKYNDKGIDLRYGAKNLNDNTVGGQTEQSIGQNGRADIDVTLNTQFSPESHSVSDEIFDKSMAIAHESFLHVNLYTKDFLDNGKFDYSNIDRSIINTPGMTRNHYQHIQVLNDYIKRGYYPGSSWPLEGYNTMNEINKKNNVGRTPAQIMQKLWNYSGGVQLDSHGRTQ